MINKSSESFNFILHNTYDVSNIQNHIKTYGDKEWLLDESRQKETIHHTKTQSYFISYFDLIDDFKGYESKYNDNTDPILVNMISPIIQDMEKIYNGVFGRIILINLPAKKEITAHFDRHEYFNIARRFHLPIISNDSVEFYVENEMVHMKEGECWEINNKKIHKVINNGNTDRIHLLFDIIPGEFL